MTNIRNMGRFSTLLMLSSTLYGCEKTRYSEVFHPEGDVSRVEIHSDSGSVSVVEGSELRVERTIRAPEGALHLSHSIVSDADGEEVLVLYADCKPILPCAVDVEMSVPSGVPVTVVLQHGEVWASNLDGLNVEIGRGSLDAVNPGPLTARVGAGQARVDLPAGGDATIAVGKGDIALRLPVGAWNVTTEGANVVMDERIQPSQHALHNLELIAPAGEIHIAPVESFANVR